MTPKPKFIDEKGFYIHITHVNMFYYAVIDIVDSVFSIAELEDYAQDRDLRSANNRLKELVYKTLRDKQDDTIRIFRKYRYPDIAKEAVEDFCNDIADLFGERWTQTTEQKYLTGMIRKAGKDGKIIFLHHNDSHDNDKDIDIMVDNLALFYLHFISLFRDSEHIFDEQNEIKKWINKYIFIDRDDRQITNFSFVNSETNMFVQMSDVVSGLCGQMYEFLNKTKNDSIVLNVEQMDDQQLICANALCFMINKSANRNPGFIFSITAQMIKERFNVFANCVSNEFNKRKL